MSTPSSPDIIKVRIVEPLQEGAEAQLAFIALPDDGYGSVEFYLCADGFRDISGKRVNLKPQNANAIQAAYLRECERYVSRRVRMQRLNRSMLRVLYGAVNAPENASIEVTPVLPLDPGRLANVRVTIDGVPTTLYINHYLSVINRDGAFDVTPLANIIIAMYRNAMQDVVPWLSVDEHEAMPAAAATASMPKVDSAFDVSSKLMGRVVLCEPTDKVTPVPVSDAKTLEPGVSSDKFQPTTAIQSDEVKPPHVRYATYQPWLMAIIASAAASIACAGFLFGTGILKSDATPVVHAPAPTVTATAVSYPFVVPEHKAGELQGYASYTEVSISNNGTRSITGLVIKNGRGGAFFAKNHDVTYLNRGDYPATDGVILGTLEPKDRLDVRIWVNLNPTEALANLRILSSEGLIPVATSECAGP